MASWITALPYIRMAGLAFVEHLKSQEPKVLMSYAAIIGLIVAFFLIRRYPGSPFLQSRPLLSRL